MKNSFWVGLLVLATVTPASADPVTDAHFVTATSTCINFGSDSWFVRDRIEDAGWTTRFDQDYHISVYDSPDRSVVLIPPPENTDLPVFCSVISQDVTLDYAENVARSVLVKSSIDTIEGIQDGCRIFRTENSVTIHVYNDGNEDMCDQPMSARIEIMTSSNPVSGQ